MSVRRDSEELTSGGEDKGHRETACEASSHQHEMAIFRDLLLRILSQQEVKILPTLTFFFLFNFHNHSIKGQNVTARFQGSVPHNIYMFKPFYQAWWPWVVMGDHEWPWVAIGGHGWSWVVTDGHRWSWCVCGGVQGRFFFQELSALSLAPSRKENWRHTSTSLITTPKYLRVC